MMRFSKLYRISFYAMLTLATLTLSIDQAQDNPLAPLYPLAVAIASVAAFLTVDRDPRRGLPPGVAKALALGSIGLASAEYAYDESLLVIAMGHLLVYLQLVKMFLPKSVEDDWILFLLALTQVVVGAFLPGDYVGYALAAWTIVALWTLSLFHLQREASPSARSKPTGRVTPSPDPAEPYPGLIDPPFVLSTFKIAGLSLALGGLVFLLMPRWSTAAPRRGRVPAMSQNLTGFSETVELGRMGEILESEEVVMSVETYDEEGQRIAPPPEALWRGVVMLRYERRRWHRQGSRTDDPESTLDVTPLPARFLRQEIRLEPTTTDTLFGLRPVLRADGPGVGFSTVNGTLARERRGRRFGRGHSGDGQYEYTIRSGLDPNRVQPAESLPRGRGAMQDLLYLPDDDHLRSVLSRIVDGQLAGIPADDMVARARALESYLRDSPEFGYTLSMAVIDPTIDPIADFLVNRKEGHCEYYGSALTLLLRAAGIPARMINGFKGGDWNALGQVLVVRQKHAHSWVEAFAGRDDFAGAPTPVWLTLDPTPPGEREEVVARVGGLAGRLRFVSDYLRYLWVFYVVGFNEARQERLIYGPIRELIDEARTGFAIMGEALSRLTSGLLHFPDVRSFFSIRGFFVSVVSLLLLAGLYRLAAWAAHRFFVRMGLAHRGDPDLASGVASYRRLVRLLGELGLHRPPAETPREFARRASDALASREPGGEGLASLPSDVVDAFYGIRFGDRRLEPADHRALETRLDALEESLRPQRA